MKTSIAVSKRILHLLGLIAGVLLWTAAGFPASGTVPSSDSTSLSEPQEGYRIDQPGTITFTVGVKISGKVEKPQVMIFLPKEKTQYRNEMVQRSFREELSQPLPFTPLME
jgi:hypothetical protein